MGKGRVLGIARLAIRAADVQVPDGGYEVQEKDSEVESAGDFSSALLPYLAYGVFPG
jgi:hypothetical protein